MEIKKFYIPPTATMIRVECVLLNNSGEGIGPGFIPGGNNNGVDDDEEPETP